MKVFGIPLRFNPGAIFVLILFTSIIGKTLIVELDSSEKFFQSFGIYLICALLLFLSVFFHELGHSLVALNQGVKVKAINFSFIGGYDLLEKECPNAIGSLKIALAGPMSTFAWAMTLKFIEIFAIGLSPVFLKIFEIVYGLNIVWLAINLLPGLPFDGGAILKATVWHFTGSQNTGLKVVNKTGRVFSIFGILFGTFLCFRGGSGLGLIFIMLGWVGFAASRAQNQIMTLQKILLEINICKVSKRRFRVFEEDNSLKILRKMRFSINQSSELAEWILLCRDGRWVGYLDNQLVKDLPIKYWNDRCLGDFIKPLDELPSISEEVPLWKAVLALERSPEKRLLVFNSAGLPAGTIDRIDLGNGVLKEIGLNMPIALTEVARKKNSYPLPLGDSLIQVVEGMILSGIVENPYEK